MRPGAASETAKGVAAHRLVLDRVPAPYGDPGADDRLQRDVAAGAQVPLTMVRYLQLRTTFFDQVVVDAVAEGIEQFVSIGAGYDGRGLRYGTASSRWFEVDQAITQADKRVRLERLGIACPHIVFAPIDLAVDALDQVLARAGQRVEQPTLFTCEGVAGYLAEEAIVTLLATARARAATGSRLAIEIPVAADSDAETRRQGQIRSVVAGLGEPMPPAIERDRLLDVVTSQGWAIEQADDPLGTAITVSTKIPAFITAHPA